MASETPTIWGIHAGKTGDADSLFRDRNVIALGWPKMGDLSGLGSARDAFKARYAEVFPDAKPGAIPTSAGQLFRFVHEAKVGDYVLYPSKQDKRIHAGRIHGDYAYDAGPEPAYPHHRPVRWLRDYARTQFSQGALYEIGSAMSFFQVKNYADEFLEVMAGRVPDTDRNGDETVGPVAEEIEQSTRDFILKQLAKELKGHPFAHFVGHLLEAIGYRTRVSPPGRDRGVDIVAHRDHLGFEPPLIKVQVKSQEGTTSDQDVSALYGKVGQQEYGLFVALGTFSSQARAFAETKSNLRLIDGNQLVDLILEHYESLDARYKGLLPMKRVYIPEALSAEGE